jgi:hypothetical protein
MAGTELLDALTPTSSNPFIIAAEQSVAVMLIARFTPQPYFIHHLTAPRAGFRSNFLSANHKSEAIAMTAPVITHGSGGSAIATTANGSS